MKVGLVPGHIVLDEDPAQLPSHKKGAQPPVFGPCLLWPKGWIDQGGAWYHTTVGLGPGNFVLDADPASPHPKGHSPQI